MRRKPRSMFSATVRIVQSSTIWNSGEVREVLAQSVLDRRAQLDLDLVRAGLIAVHGQLPGARALERAARARADRLACARGRDHVAGDVRQRALHLDALDPGRALAELGDQDLVAR